MPDCTRARTTKRRLSRSFTRVFQSLLQALGEVADRERVAVLDPAVAGVEELEEDVGDPELLQLAPECLGAEVEVELVALAGVDIERALAAQRVRVASRHPHGIPGEPPLPDVVPKHPGRGVEGEFNGSVLVRRVAG